MSSMVITLLNSLPMYRLPGYRGALAVRFCAHHNVNHGTVWSGQDKFRMCIFVVIIESFCSSHKSSGLAWNISRQLIATPNGRPTLSFLLVFPPCIINRFCLLIFIKFLLT